MITVATDLARQRAHLVADEVREKLIGRVAVLSAYVDRLLAALAKAGVRAPAAPNLDDVRPAILAEGVALRLKLQDAELRIADDEIKQLQREKGELRRRLEALERRRDIGQPAAVGAGTTGFVPLEASDIAPAEPPESADDFEPSDAISARESDRDPEAGERVQVEPSLAGVEEDADTERAPSEEPLDHARHDATATAEVEQSAAHERGTPKPAPQAPLAKGEGRARPREAGGWFVGLLTRIRHTLRPERSIDDIMALEGRTRSAVLQSGKRAVDAGLVEVRHEGRTPFYRIKASA